MPAPVPVRAFKYLSDHPEVPDLALDLLIAPELFGILGRVGVVDDEFAVFQPHQHDVVSGGGPLNISWR